MSGWRPTADVEGVVVPNGQGQGLEPPSKPIGCIPNIAAGILGLLCGETCVASRVGRVRSVKVSEFDTIDTEIDTTHASQLSESPVWSV